MDKSTNAVDFLLPIRPLIHFLRLAGLWPTASHRCTFAIYAVYTFLFQIIFTFAYDFFKCINFLLITDLSTVTRAMFICFTELSLSVKIVNFYCRIRTIQKCLNTVQTTVRVERPCEARLFTEKFSVLSKIITWYLISANMAGVFSYTSPLLVSDSSVLPYPGWYPVDWEHNDVAYWLVYAYQVVGMFFQIQTLVIIEVYFIYLMVAISTQLDIIGQRMERIGWIDDVEKHNRTQKSGQIDVDSEAALIDCFRDHREILRFASTVETAGSIPYFVQFIFSGIVLCVSVFQIAIMDPTKEIADFGFYVSFVMTMLTQIFLPCYFGNEIVLKSGYLSRAIYFSNWPERSQRYRKLVIIYLEMLHRPTQLNVFGIFSLTLISFLSVLNKAYSLYAVLQSFVE